MLARAIREQGHRSIAFVSAAAGEGVTTSALGVAEQMSLLEGMRVLVIEMGGGRRARLRGAAINGQGCVEEVLAGSRTIDDCIQEVPGRPGVWMLPSRTNQAIPTKPSAIADLKHAAEAAFDLVLWDGGALLSTSGSIGLLSVVPQVVLVVQAGRLPHEVIERARHDLDLRGITVLGAILNKHRRFIPRWLYSMLSH